LTESQISMLRVQSGPSSSSLVALSTLTAAMAVLFDRPLAPPAGHRRQRWRWKEDEDETRKGPGAAVFVGRWEWRVRWRG
jgi:hypothetical protein